jgi:hypothetical protein
MTANPFWLMLPQELNITVIPDGGITNE